VDHWAVLGVAPGSTVAEIRRAFRARALQVHPDRPGGSAAAFRELHDAAVRCLLETTTTEAGDPADEDGWPLVLPGAEPGPAGFWQRRVEPVIDATFALGAIVVVLGVGYVAIVTVLTVAAIVLHAALVPLLRVLTPG
jgi:hypothetical protein